MVVVSGIISKRNTNQLSHCPNLVLTLSRPFSQVRTLPFFRIYKNPLPITCHSLLFFIKLINIYIVSIPLHLLGKTTKNRDLFSNFKFHRKPLFETSGQRCVRCGGEDNDSIMVRSFSLEVRTRHHKRKLEVRTRIFSNLLTYNRQLYTTINKW